MTKIVEIKCLKHTYNDNIRIEICGIDFNVEKGQKIAVLGPNGGGKTTLIKHILGVLTPSEGIVSIFGVDPSKDFNKIRHKIGVVLQNVEEQLIGPTVFDDIMFSPLNYGFSSKEATVLTDKIMEKLEITHLKDRIIHYLSGGEKRKVALAGALVMEPELLILDEPFSALDMKSQKSLIDLINKISKEKGMSVIISTHEVDLVSDFADFVYLISNQDRLFTKGETREILIREDLECFNLESPSVLKLFNRLKQEGYDLGTPINIDEAVEFLKEKLSYR